MTEQNVLDQVARYAPTRRSVGREWSSSRSAAVLGVITADEAGKDAEVGPLRFVSAAPRTRTSRWTRLLPLAASGAVLAIAAGVLIAALPAVRSGDGTGVGRQVNGPVFHPPAGLSDRAIGAHEFSYRVLQQVQLDERGRPVPNAADAMTMRTYVAPDGSMISDRSGHRNGCFQFSHGPSGGGSFEMPTHDFFRSLPTDVAKLGNYLRTHAQGSSSRDEAVFVAVGDALRQADGLASPRLRAAMVAVLSRTPGVTLHTGQRDYLGRDALRLDFVDQRIRPGEVSSLYFQPKTFQLLEQRDGRNGEPTRYAGPSPAYDGHGQTGRDPDQLTGAAFITVTRSEQVLDKAPTTCKKGQ